MARSIIKGMGVGHQREYFHRAIRVLLGALDKGGAFYSGRSGKVAQWDALS
jgi:hypothetical protein